MRIRPCFRYNEISPPTAEDAQSESREMTIMYKVVLIDDESIITEGLQKVVDWAAHNCQVVALAPDADCRPHRLPGF